MEEESKESYYALNVALKTLSERCEQMQSRIKLLEDENMDLRTKCLDTQLTSKNPLSESIQTLQSELVELREKNCELNRQKHSLSVHIEIVAAENRQLWSRLSNMTKVKEEPVLSPTAHQNLIRSKTFTQNNPNPKLREKFKPNEDPEDLVVDVAKFAISDNGAGIDASEEFKKLTEELLELKQEASRQNSVLKVTHDKIKEGKRMFVCKNCASSSKKKGEVKKDETVKNPGFVDVELNTTEHIDFLATKRKADTLNSTDRICPMCGKLYPKDRVFEEFMEHVEAHFLDGDDDDDESMPSFYGGHASDIIHNF